MECGKRIKKDAQSEQKKVKKNAEVISFAPIVKSHYHPGLVDQSDNILGKRKTTMLTLRDDSDVAEVSNVCLVRIKKHTESAKKLCQSKQMTDCTIISGSSDSALTSTAKMSKYDESICELSSKKIDETKNDVKLSGNLVDSHVKLAANSTGIESAWNPIQLRADLNNWFIRLQNMNFAKDNAIMLEYLSYLNSSSLTGGFKCMNPYEASQRFNNIVNRNDAAKLEDKSSRRIWTEYFDWSDRQTRNTRTEPVANVNTTFFANPNFDSLRNILTEGCYTIDVPSDGSCFYHCIFAWLLLEESKAYESTFDLRKQFANFIEETDWFTQYDLGDSGLRMTIIEHFALQDKELMDTYADVELVPRTIVESKIGNCVRLLRQFNLQWTEMNECLYYFMARFLKKTIYMYDLINHERCVHSTEDLEMTSSVSIVKSEDHFYLLVPLDYVKTWSKRKRSMYK